MEWTQKMWSTGTTEFFSTIKKNGVMLFSVGKKWIQLEILILNKLSVSDKYHIF